MSPSAKALLDPVRLYLDSPRCAVLSSLRADGAPHQTVVHYLLGPDHLLVNGRPDRRWVSNLRRDPHVSVVVHDADEPLHWVGMRGQAQVLNDGAAAVSDAMSMARRYGEDPQEYSELERISLIIFPDHVFEYGATGHRSRCSGCGSPPYQGIR
jgi:PPOX class probable F420-dependent enzyme